MRPGDLDGFTQCHFFAGIGGWPLALRLAGWPEARPVWTGSCPCQPFSTAGKGLGIADERHLWPVFAELIRACQPPVIFGEQVASSEVFGTDLEADFFEAVRAGDCARANKIANRLVKSSSLKAEPRWLDGICADLEAAGYTVGATDLPAAGCGAPHIRQRLWWVAHGTELGCGQGGEIERRRVSGSAAAGERIRSLPGSATRRLGVTDGPGSQPGIVAAAAARHGHSLEPASGAGGVEHAAGGGAQSTQQPGQRNGVKPSSCWSDFDLIPCRDGKTRRVESGTFPLADGVPARVVRLRGYGNAIVPQVAAEFIAAFATLSA